MIRKAEIKDLDSIVDLWIELSQYHELVDDSFKLKKDIRENYKSYAKSVIETDEKLSIIFEDTKILGYLFAEIKKHPPIFFEETFGFISEICVTTNCRRKGVGNQLILFAENWFKEQGINRIECFVASKNMISNGFWKKQGYGEYLSAFKKTLK